MPQRLPTDLKATGEDGLTSRRSEMRLEALEDDLLARHQKKLRFKQLEDQLNEENQLILDLIKLYEEEADYQRSKKSSSATSVDNPEVAAEVGEADWPGSSKTIKDKKDLEYMAYQADPSLTVENLSVQP